jgi:hypothetical protein
MMISRPHQEWWDDVLPLSLKRFLTNRLVVCVKLVEQWMTRECISMETKEGRTAQLVQSIAPKTLREKQEWEWRRKGGNDSACMQGNIRDMYTKPTKPSDPLTCRSPDPAGMRTGHCY